MRRTRGRCAYCGVGGVRLEREHPIPRCLYPASLNPSSVQRITVPACAACNRGWSDDEAHFRNVLLVAGEPNDAVTELWEGKAARSFYEIDGRRRVTELFKQMIPVMVGDQKRWMIYPGKDERVIRVVRKIVRGLSSFHRIESAVQETRVWADVLKFRIPDYLMDSVTFYHREADILRYWYEAYDEGEISSSWLLTFFERRTFVATVERRDGTAGNHR